MALRDWPLCDAKLVLWSQRPLRGVRITPGSQPLRPSVRAGAPPLGRGGQTPKPPTDPKTGGACNGASRLAAVVSGHYGIGAFRSGA